MRAASGAEGSLRTVPKIRASEVPCLLSGCLTDGEEDDHVREEGRGSGERKEPNGTFNAGGYQDSIKMRMKSPWTS